MNRKVPVNSYSSSSLTYAGSLDRLCNPIFEHSKKDRSFRSDPFLRGVNKLLDGNSLFLMMWVLLITVPNVQVRLLMSQYDSKEDETPK